MRRRTWFVLALLVVLAAACGDDEGSVFSSGAGATTAGATTTTRPTTTTAAITTTTAPQTTTTTAASGSEEELVDLLASELTTADSPFDDESARCFAEGAVDEMGYERLAALGATAAGPEEIFREMSGSEIDTLADLALGCLDMHALFVEQFVANGLPQDAAVCIADGLAGADFLHDMLVGALQGEVIDPMTDPAASTLIMDLVTLCLA